MKLTIVLKKHDADGLGGQILTDMGMTRSAYEPEVFTTRHVQDPRIVAPVDVTEQMWPVMYVEALMDEGIRPMRVYQKDNSTLTLTPLWASASGKPDPQAVADVLEAAANALEASAAKACICDEYPDDDEVRQTADNWQGEGCENYDDSQDVCLDEVKASSGSLHDRIAKALKWPLKDVQSMSLASLRDLVRPVDKKLADEISDTLRSGGHLKAAKKPLGVSDKEFWALLSDKKAFQQLLENTERHHKAQKEWEDAAPQREALEKAEKEADATWAKLTPEQKRRYRRDDRIWDHPFGAAGVAHEDKLAGKLTASKGVIDKKTWKLLREKANDALVQAGFDGNGRFRSMAQANNKIADVLEKHGLQLGEVMSADLFREPARTHNFDLEFVNPMDSFSPVAFGDSKLRMSYYTMDNGQIEVVAYLS